MPVRRSVPTSMRQWLVSVLFLVALLPLHSLAQLQELKVIADDATGEDHFGRAMSMSGDLLAVGALSTLTSDGNRGAVYIYQRSGTDWILDDKVESGERGGFGRSVGIDGEYLVVARCRKTSGGACDPTSAANGHAYIYHREASGWVLQNRLEKRGQPFGTSAAISGDYVLIGADGDDDVAVDAGAVYVYRRDIDTWIESAKLTASDGQSGDAFGYSLAVSGDYALIGAWHALEYQGAAYIFERQADDTWIETAKLTADDGAAGDQFGSWFIDIDGDYAVVGAMNDDDLGTDAGSAYIFHRESSGIWTQQAKLLASNGISNDRFGTSAAISGDYALIGSFDGAYAYIFHRDGEVWTEQFAITSSDYEDGDDFAYAVALEGDYAAIGADDDKVNGVETGSAYLYWGFADVETGLVVSNVPDQTITTGGAFAPIALDEYVSHDTFADDEMLWAAFGQTELDVVIDADRIATVTPVPGWTGSETITFEATAPDSTIDSDDAAFTVNEPAPLVVSDIPDQTITTGGSFATIALDDFVSHGLFADDEMLWAVSGQTELDVIIDVERIATVTPLPGWTGSETITFEATAPDSMVEGDDATFTVNETPPTAPSNLSVAFTGTVATLEWDGEATDILCTSLADTVIGSSYSIIFPDDVGYNLPQNCSVSNAAGSSNITGKFGCRNADDCRVR